MRPWSDATRYYWSVRPWSDASRFLSWARDWAHLPSLVMLIFFFPFSWDSMLIAHLYLHLHLHLHRSLLFLHHYSYNISCLSSRLAIKQARRFLLACLLACQGQCWKLACLLVGLQSLKLACYLLVCLYDMIFFSYTCGWRGVEQFKLLRQRYVGNKARLCAGPHILFAPRPTYVLTITTTATPCMMPRVIAV